MGSKAPNPKNAQNWVSYLHHCSFTVSRLSRIYENVHNNNFGSFVDNFQINTFRLVSILYPVVYNLPK